MSEQGRIPLDFTEYGPDEMVRRSSEFRETASKRRSVRDFDGRPVPREVIKNAILAAGSAPSGANLQPWHFVVVSDPAVKRAIREKAEEIERGFYREKASPEWLEALTPLQLGADKPFLTAAPTLIVVFRRNHIVDEDGTLQKTYYPMESVGIATGMLIAALHHAGVGTLPYTPSPMSFLCELLGRPESDRPFLILAVGYPAPDATVPDLDRRALGEIADFVEE